VLKISNLGSGNYQFGSKFKAILKVIEGTLCATLGGSYIPFDDFVKIQFLTILEKEDSKKVKDIIKEQ